MSTFERYLTVWVALCIVVGIALGHVIPGVFQAIGAAEIAKVNLPVAALIWLMIIPMLVRIDFAALGQVKEHWRGIGVTLFINWAVKPFSMAALGWLFIGYLFRPYLPAGADRQLHRRPDHPGRCALHRHGVRVVEPHPWRAALHAEPGRAQRHHHGVRVCADRRLPARALRHHRAVGHAGAVGGALHRGAGDRRAECCAGGFSPAAASRRCSACSAACSRCR